MRLALAAGLLALLLAACTPAVPVQRVQGASMGTTWSAQFVAADDRRAAIEAAIAAELRAVVDEMSAWEPDSALSRFNAAPAGTTQSLPPSLYDVFEHALSLAADTGGAYDPTVGPLVDLWGFGPQGAPRSEPPPPQAIDAARARVGFARIVLLPPQAAVQPGGVAMDISSLGPGHALDRIGARLRALGVRDFLIELGGEMLASGRKPGGGDWRIAVEPDDDGDYDLVVALRDAAAGSSGDYRVGFESGGRRYSHTIDPRTGAPVRHALAGVTVIASRAMQADALAAALMVLGPDEGLDYATRRDVAAVFTLRQNGRFLRRSTPAFDAVAKGGR